jgi:hypothetical protein
MCFYYMLFFAHNKRKNNNIKLYKNRKVYVYYE